MCVYITVFLDSIQDIPYISTIVHGDMGCGKNSFKLVCRCHQLLSGILANGHLPRVARQSSLSANDKGDNAILMGAAKDMLLSL